MGRIVVGGGVNVACKSGNIPHSTSKANLGTSRVKRGSEVRLCGTIRNDLFCPIIERLELLCICRTSNNPTTENWVIGNKEEEGR